MSEQINDKPTLTEIIQKFADINGISIEEAETIIGDTEESQVLKKITQYTLNKIREKMPVMNRAQRRALAKKQGKNPPMENTIADVTRKINYINLIQKLRKLNEEQEKNVNETNGSPQVK